MSQYAIPILFDFSVCAIPPCAGLQRFFRGCRGGDENRLEYFSGNACHAHRRSYAPGVGRFFLAFNAPVSSYKTFLYSRGGTPLSAYASAIRQRRFRDSFRSALTLFSRQRHRQDRLRPDGFDRNHLLHPVCIFPPDKGKIHKKDYSSSAFGRSCRTSCRCSFFPDFLG